MRTIQIRNVPDDVHRTLRARAAARGVSLSDLALDELERVARRPPVSEVLRRARATGGSTSTAVVVDAIRAGRDR